MEANINNYTFVEVEEKICEYCDSINSYDKTNTCRNCGGNKYRINKVKVKTLKSTPKPIIIPKCETTSKNNNDSISTKKVVACMVGIFSVILLIYIIIIIIGNTTTSYDKEFHVGEHTCIHCGSNDTEGYHVFWYNSGLICNGSYEYNMSHADYTIISCNNCGNSFKYYL
jgi:ribosomal protein L40E